MENEFIIDNSAKLKIDLFRAHDRNNNPYFVGKLQMPGFLSFEEGASFMVFCSEEGTEELQIGPLDSRKRSSKVRNTSVNVRDKLRIDLHATQDSEGKTYYIGEAIAPAQVPLRKGIFFSIFLSQEGREELQISPLRHKPRGRDEQRDYRNGESTDENHNVEMSPA